MDAQSLTKRFFEGVTHHCLKHTDKPIDCMYSYRPERVGKAGLSKEMLEVYAKAWEEWFSEQIAYFVSDELYLSALNSLREMNGEIKDAFIKGLKGLQDLLRVAVKARSPLTVEALRQKIEEVVNVLPKKPADEKIAYYLFFYNGISDNGKIRTLKALIKEINGVKREFEYDYRNLRPKLKG